MRQGCAQESLARSRGANEQDVALGDGRAVLLRFGYFLEMRVDRHRHRFLGVVLSDHILIEILDDEAWSDCFVEQVGVPRQKCGFPKYDCFSSSSPRSAACRYAVQARSSWRIMDWKFDNDQESYRLLICAMTAIRSNGRAAIACLLVLMFAGTVVIPTSAASPAEVLLRGEAGQDNSRRPALDEDRRLRDERAAMVRTQIASRGIRNE